ncbi:hypothetical protein B0H63DRAFT_480704 [Podospora didyma]|uniref:Ubiquitin 3 binding protein But2 C-terminal domain-containing protein n=1 Tax=Podospora didyma TaxID=330526 RepID=A0AAE0KDR3_9PEZI|nr:hypothetical protein B0H63DRAFT_480704 [Podospora didyma]
MMFPPISFLTATVTALFVIAALAAPNDTSLAVKPWEISGVGTHSPSGYPANAPYSTLFVSISDPNHIVLGSTRFGDAAFPPSSVNCTVRWLGALENPYGWVNTCTDINHGKWTVEILPGVVTTSGPQSYSSPTTNFVLRFTLSEAVVLMTGTIYERFVGTAAFAVGDNMSGSCGGSGVCNWGLKETVVRPVLVNQTLVETRCLFGSCE